MRRFLVSLILLLCIATIAYSPSAVARPASKSQALSTAVDSHSLTVHTGSYSIDYHSLSLAEIDSHVQAIVTSIPSANYIAIGSYLDYPDQIALWANSIHAHGRNVFYRSAGFNAWRGTNGAAATETPTEYRTALVAFLQTNHDYFRSGDIFEAVPDEPENGTYWYTTYGTNGVGANTQSIAEFNEFIQEAVSDAQTTFTASDVIGVSTGYIFTNPSVARDVIDDTTAANMVIGTDDYPENGLVTSAQMATALRAELNTWVVSAHLARPKNITIGPSVYAQLSQKIQSDAYRQEYTVIKQTIPSLDGVTVWQSGATYNPLSRIFDYGNGVWIARNAAATINGFRN